MRCGEIGNYIDYFNIDGYEYGNYSFEEIMFNDEVEVPIEATANLTFDGIYVNAEREVVVCVCESYDEAKKIIEDYLKKNTNK